MGASSSGASGHLASDVYAGYVLFMGRIVTRVEVSNPIEPAATIVCDALVDTEAAWLTLPASWKPRLGNLRLSRQVELETADQRTVRGEICGPVSIEVEGFGAVSGEVAFLDMTPGDGGLEPLLGYIVLEQAQVAVDMIGHRLVAIKHADLK